jgi:hypothetical protein
VSDTQPVARKASRLALPRWADPKLLFGVLLVVVAMLLGARVFAMADNTVEVYAVKSDMKTGDALLASSVVAVRVRFTGSNNADAYVSATEAIPSAMKVTHDLRAGEFLPRSAFASTTQQQLLDMAIPVKDEAIPPISIGDHVNVVVQPQTTSGQSSTPVMVLKDVPVVQVPSNGGGGITGGSASAGLTVRVDPAKQPGFDQAKVSGLMAQGTVLVIRIG